MAITIYSCHVIDKEVADCRVLMIVEDDPAIAEMYTYALHRAGYDVLIAGSTGAALKLLQEEAPDLVLMDIGLPGESGLEMLRRLRSSASTAELPVVMLTNYGDPAFIRESAELGAIDYLIKSRTSPSLLAERVRSWCSGLPARNQTNP